MPADSQDSLAGPLLAQVSGRFSPEEVDRVRNAYDLGAHWHQGQWRKSGARYITHPLAVAEAAAAAGLDCVMVCAALLHDVPEDTGCDPELLRAEFGGEIADLVEGLAAFGHSAAVPGDDRVIVLKLLDHLHNMQTIEYLDAGKQLSKSRETLERLVPHARRLGLPAVADELQELAQHRIEILAGDNGPGITVTARALQLGSLLLPATARTRYLEEWAAELRTAAQQHSCRFAWQLMLGLPRLSITLRGPRWAAYRSGIMHRVAASHLTRPGHKALLWLLRSEARSWALLAPLTAWIVMQTAQGNAGNALVTIITLPPVLAAAVKWLRGRLGITQRHHDGSP
jgi:HD domain-containing protein